MLKLSRPSPALVVATIALFIAAGGGAWAATKSPSSAVYAQATHPTASIAARARADLAVFVAHAGSAGPADSPALAAPKVPPDRPTALSSPSSRSSTWRAGEDTKVAQLSLTVGGSYIITASTSLAGNASLNDNFVTCTLLQNANPVGVGTALLAPGKAAFTQSMTLTAGVDTNDGSNVSLSCNPDGLGFARNVAITAVRVGTLHTS